MQAIDPVSHGPRSACFPWSADWQREARTLARGGRWGRCGHGPVACGRRNASHPCSPRLH